MSTPESFDVVVVGSGFGGSVTAYRVAAAGHSVCVLERGQAYPPNSFARTAHEFSRAFWKPDQKLPGLFEVWSFEHIDAIVSAGLGGGSLIYANVLIRKDEHWFAADASAGTPAWPVSREDLDPHYDTVEKMLNGQTFPLGQTGYGGVHKTGQFRDAARSLGFTETTHDNIDPTKPQWYLPLLAVTFHNKGRSPIPGECIHEDLRNLHDRDRQTCRLCGECDIGCNYGAKNTLDYNYLTAAKHHGAEIRTLANVQSFAPVGPGDEGFEIIHDQYELDENGAVISAKELVVHARHLVLSAGTIGTNHLLLRNHESFPNLSADSLGQRFSGNGDFLSIALEAQHSDHTPRVLEPSRGPVITSTLRAPDALDGAKDGSRGFYLQDAGYPVLLDWLLELPHLVEGVPGFVLDRIVDHLCRHSERSNIAGRIDEIIGNAAGPAGTMPLLGMGRDVAGGNFALHGDDLLLNWNKRASSPFFDEAADVSLGMADALGAKFLEDPLTSRLGRLITVHPLGGCAMSEEPSGGVVDPQGRVHGYPALHIADGSVMPGAVGANPSLTIAALADHFADSLVASL